MEGCERGATGNFTRRMYSADSGENWPDDVSERPICWYHHVLLESVKAGTAAAMFGLVVAVAAWFSEATVASYLYLTAALLAGLGISVTIGLIRRGQVVSHD